MHHVTRSIGDFIKNEREFEEPGDIQQQLTWLLADDPEQSQRPIFGVNVERDTYLGSAHHVRLFAISHTNLHRLLLPLLSIHGITRHSQGNEYETKLQSTIDNEAPPMSSFMT